MTRLSLALAFFGILLATLLVGWTGFEPITAAILSVGWAGFLGYVGWQAAVVLLLGMAWWAVAPPASPLAIFAWGRAVRDAAGSCLPFSQVGGFVLGARAVVLGGVPAPIASVTTVVDITAEFVAEILFLIIGLLILLDHSQDRRQSLLIELGMGVSLFAAIAGFLLQRRGAALFVSMGRRLMGQWFAGRDRQNPISDADLAAIYGHKGRLAAGVLLHLLGWIGKGGGNWIAFLLLGQPVSLAEALAIEALLHAMLAAAFLVPGLAGVQEAGYVGLGTLFGIAPEISLSVSLLRRARDLALGVPVLLVWQWLEMRHLPGKQATRS